MMFKPHKYKAKKTPYNGFEYPSKHEANIAYRLDMRLRAGEIKHWEHQYKISIELCNSEGKVKHVINHKVDFRIFENDGSFTLLEAKGFETREYKRIKKLIHALWLPVHQNYSYEVIKL